MEQQFNFHVDVQGPLGVLHLSGSLAQLGVYRFKAAVEKMINDGMRFAIIDMAELTYIDSAGMGSLTQMRAHLQKNAGVLTLAEPRGEFVRSAMQMAQIGKAIPCFETIAEARQFISDKYGFAVADGARVTASAGEQPSDRAVLEALRSIDNRLVRLEDRISMLAAAMQKLSCQPITDNQATQQ